MYSKLYKVNNVTYKFEVYIKGFDKEPDVFTYIDKIEAILAAAINQAAENDDRATLSAFYSIADTVIDSFGKLYKEGLLLANPTKENILTISKIITNEAKRKELVSNIKAPEFN